MTELNVNFSVLHAVAGIVSFHKKRMVFLNFFWPERLVFKLNTESPSLDPPLNKDMDSSRYNSGDWLSCVTTPEACAVPPTCVFQWSSISWSPWNSNFYKFFVRN